MEINDSLKLSFYGDANLGYLYRAPAIRLAVDSFLLYKLLLGIPPQISAKNDFVPIAYSTYYFQPMVQATCIDPNMRLRVVPFEFMMC